MATALAFIGGKVGAAIIGSAVIGGIATSRAAGKAAKGQERALGAATTATGQARGDVTRLFGTAGEARERGFGRALDFLSKAPGAQIAPFQRGNILAQEQIARGLPQIQRAILGQPTDLSGFQARTVGAPESFNIDLSGFRREPEAPIATPGTQETQGRSFAAFRNQNILTGRSTPGGRGRITRLK